MAFHPTQNKTLEDPQGWPLASWPPLLMFCLSEAPYLWVSTCAVLRTTHPSPTPGICRAPNTCYHQVYQLFKFLSLLNGMRTGPVLDASISRIWHMQLINICWMSELKIQTLSEVKVPSGISGQQYLASRIWPSPDHSPPQAGPMNLPPWVAASPLQRSWIRGSGSKQAGQMCSDRESILVSFCSLSPCLRSSFPKHTRNPAA